MEGMIAFHNHLDTLRSQITAQVDAVQELQATFAQQAEQLRRNDQVQHIDRIREELSQEIRIVEYAEAWASRAYTNSKMKDSLIVFGVGFLEGLFVHKQTNPLKIASARFVQYQSTGTAQYNNIVMVGMGPGGVPNDLRVFPISRLARQQCISESEVRAELQAKGHRLFTEGAFFKFLSNLRNEIIQGTSRLPAAKADTVITFVPRGGSPQRLIQNGGSSTSFG